MPTSSSRRTGQRVGIAVYGAVLGGFTVVCSIQILSQVWAPAARAADVECRPGITALVRAVGRAREAAGKETGGEREAMFRFRAALDPEWTLRATLDERCRTDGEALKALRDVDRYRYAEEHAVRYAAANLSHVRQQMELLESALSD
jgi:hypothetical protein